MAQNSFHWRYDTGYKINDPCIKKLIKFIYDQGHVIGFHPGYLTFLNEKKFFEEAQLFKRPAWELELIKKNLGAECII